MVYSDSKALADLGVSTIRLLAKFLKKFSVIILLLLGYCQLPNRLFLMPLSGKLYFSI